MTCAIPAETLEKAVEFHGHVCPGLIIGVRAAELALGELEPARDMDLVAVCETDMCGVDAIQFLTGCTLGKGNLLLRDYGKMAFVFHNRATGKGFRALLRPESRGEMDRELGELMCKVASGQASEAERARAEELRERLRERFMDLPLEDMFEVTWLESEPPRPPRILTSLKCASCGEPVMESRTRRMEGKTYCIPCFERVEQKR